MTKLGRLALIPARGGSRRLPRKNIIDFAGRPMLAWTIEAARESGIFDTVLVSTEDDEIAATAARYGARIMRRGPELSDDKAALVEVVKDVLTCWCKQAEELCILLANCPLRTAEDIVVGYSRFSASGAPAVLSVASYCWTRPFRAQFMEGGRLIPVFGDWVQKKSQEYPEVVCPSGAVYWGRPQLLRPANSLYVSGIEGFLMPWHRAIDIDTDEDYRLALGVRRAIDQGHWFGS